MNKILVSLFGLALLSGSVSAQTITTPTPVSANSLSGVAQYANGTIFTSTADSSLATASELSCVGTGVGTQSIPANSVAVGTKFRLSCRGIYTTPAANTATVTVKVKWGSTAVATIATGAIPASQTNQGWTLDADCTVRTVGSSGSMTCTVTFFYSSTTVAAGGVTSVSNVTSPVTIATDSANTLGMTWTWSSVSGGQTATSSEASLQVIN